MKSFEYCKPSSLSEAAKLLANGDARALAGGHTLLPAMKQRLDAPSMLVDLSGVSELGGEKIREEKGALVIGALARHAEVAACGIVQKAIPALAKLAGGIGDAQVRNRGTLGGSLANNDPAADYPAAALALGATVRTNKREIGADDFFTGLFSTALDAGEIIMSVLFPIPERAGYAKFPQPASLYALTGVFAAKTKSGVRVAVTGAGADGVFRAKELESALEKDFSAKALDGVKVSAKGLNGDIHGSPEYRASLIVTMAKRAAA